MRYLVIQKRTSTILRILIPVNRPRIPPYSKYTREIFIYIRELNIPKAESLSKNVSLLLLTVTETVSVAILKVTSALYGSSLLQSSASSEVAVIFRKLLTL